MYSRHGCVAFLQVLLSLQRHVQPKRVLRSRHVLTSWECNVSSGTPRPFRNTCNLNLSYALVKYSRHGSVTFLQVLLGLAPRSVAAEVARGDPQHANPLRQQCNGGDFGRLQTQNPQILEANTEQYIFVQSLTIAFLPPPPPFPIPTFPSPLTTAESSLRFTEVYFLDHYAAICRIFLTLKDAVMARIVK